MSYLGEKPYCSIEFNDEILEMCFLSERMVYIYTYNLGCNILELYNVLVQVQFTTIKTKCDI